jgi:arylsulfatase A-like enzyme
MGVFALKGPGVRQDFHLEKAAIIDVAPTVLYLAGLPVPKDMDGGVLTDCFDPEHLASSPVSYGEGDQRTAGGDAYTADEAAVIVEKLRDLGYVE